MKNNPLFLVKDNMWLKECDDEFKNRTLYFNLQNNLTKLLIKVKNNTDFRGFLQNRSKHKNFRDILKFYSSYLSEKLFTVTVQEFIDKIVSKNIKKIILNGYIEKSDFDNFLEEGDFEQYSKKEIQEYIDTLFSDYEKEKALESVEIFDKIQSDFIFLKNEFFLDYSDNKEKIYINIEWLFGHFQMYDGEYISEKDMVFFILIQEIGGLFTNVVSENSNLIKFFTSISKDYFGQKYTKSKMFYLIIYNKILSNFSENFLEKAVNKFNLLIKQGYLKIKVGNLFEILSKDIFKSEEYAFLWKHNFLFCTDNTFNELFITKDFFDEIYKNDNKKELKVFENIESSEILSKNIYENKIYEKSILITKSFFETNNIIKRNIPFKLSDIKKYKPVYKNCKNGIGNFIQYFLHQDYDEYLMYEVLLSPLFKASKKLITANFYDSLDFSISDTFEETFNYFLKEKKDKYIKIDDFIDSFFEESMDTFILFQSIRKELEYGLKNKVTEYEMKKYLFSEKQLFKRLLEYLAKIGYVDIAGNTEKKEIIYNSGSGGYGWGSYGLYENNEIVEQFESEYIKLKDPKIDIKFEEKNYISGQEIYLSLNTDINIIEKFSKFTILKKLENYIVLDLNRDTLIKAKNTYNLSILDIEKVFLEIELNLPKNINILLKSIDNQKSDVNILPNGIPIFIESMGLFQEFNKLKMFSKYIIFSDEEKQLIIFSSNFIGLENLLNKRKILFYRK